MTSKSKTKTRPANDIAALLREASLALTKARKLLKAKARKGKGKHTSTIRGK